MDVWIKKQTENIHTRRRGEKTLLRERDQCALANLSVWIAKTLDDSRFRRWRAVFADDHGGATACVHIVALQIAQAFGNGLGFRFTRRFRRFRLLGAYGGHCRTQDQHPKRFPFH